MAVPGRLQIWWLARRASSGWLPSFQAGCIVQARPNPGARQARRRRELIPGSWPMVALAVPDEGLDLRRGPESAPEESSFAARRPVLRAPPATESLRRQRVGGGNRRHLSVSEQGRAGGAAQYSGAGPPDFQRDKARCGGGCDVFCSYMKQALDPERGRAKSPPPPPLTGQRLPERSSSSKEWLDAEAGDAKYAPPLLRQTTP